VQLDLNQICSRIYPKFFQEFSKIMLFQCSHYASIMPLCKQQNVDALLEFFITKYVLLLLFTITVKLCKQRLRTDVQLITYNQVIG